MPLGEFKMLPNKEFNPDSVQDLGAGVVHIPTPMGVIGITKVPASKTLVVEFVSAKLPYVNNVQKTYTVYVHLPTYLSKELFTSLGNVGQIIQDNEMTMILNVVAGLSNHFGLIDVIDVKWSE